MKPLVLACVVALVLGGRLTAQDTPVPTLSEVQRLTLQNRVLAFQLAQAQLDKARSEIEAILKELQQPGFDLDLQTLTYVPKKPDPTPATKATP